MNFANFIRNRQQQRAAPEPQQQQAVPAQSQGGFAAMPARGIAKSVQKPIDPHEHKQYVSGQVGGYTF